MSSKLKLISFDAWNTLLRLDLITESIAAGIGSLLNIDSRSVCRKMIETYEELRRKWLLGELEEQSILRIAQAALADNLDTSPDLISRGVARGAAMLDPRKVVYPEVREVLENLSDRFCLVVISNVFYWPGSYTRLILEKAGLAGFFKAQLYADEVGLSKPDKRIFVKASLLCGIDPESSIHVGDSLAEDIGGALSAGMKAAYLRRGSGRFQVVRELGLALISDLTQLEKAIELLSEEQI